MKLKGWIDASAITREEVLGMYEENIEMKMFVERLVLIGKIVFVSIIHFVIGLVIGARFL